VNLCDSSK